MKETLPMNEIKIAEKKNVTFNNVLSRRLEAIDEESVDKSSKMFESYVKREGLTPYGPLIVRETTKLVGKEIDQKSEMLIQVKEAPSNVADPYAFEPKVRLEGCLMARFIGPLDKMHMAYSKMQVYAYEHDINLGPVNYTVLSKGENGEFTADIFNEVL